MPQERTIQPDGHLHGVIVACQRDSRWLLIRRSKSLVAPLKICFPGGGIDAEESQSDAVIREMREELDAIVTPVHCCWKTIYAEHHITLWGWYAELHSEQLIPAPDEVAEILWLTEDEIHNNPEVIPGTDAFILSLNDYQRRL